MPLFLTLISIATSIAGIAVSVSKNTATSDSIPAKSILLQQNALVDSLLSASYNSSNLDSLINYVPGAVFVLNGIGGHTFNFSSGTFSNSVNPKRQGDVTLKEDANGAVQFPFNLGSITYQAQFSMDDKTDASGSVSADISNVLINVLASKQGFIDLQVTNSGQFDLKEGSTSSELLQHKSEVQKGLHEAIIKWFGQEAKADAALLSKQES